VLVGLVLAACASPQGAKAPGETSLEPRAAIFTEPQRAPEPTWVAHTGSPVVSLRTPFSRGEVVQLLEAYFQAVALESNTRLSELLTEDATLHFSLQKPGGSALVGWVRRFAQYDYQTADPRGLYDPSAVELYTPADVAAFQDASGLAFLPEGDQMLARVQLTPAGRSNRFGDELQLLITPQQDALLIRRIYERGFVPR
jgi:hypothetical protein